MQAALLTGLVGLLRYLPAPLRRVLDAWARREAQRRLQRRRDQALARR